MKKLYTFLVLLLSLATFAQAPEGFNYQATVRNSAGALILNKSVTFTFKIIKDSPTGTAVYSETRAVTTDDLGAVSLVVGQGTPTTGTFSAVDWSNGTYYLGIDLNTGSGNVAMGTTQLLSVPYALYAKRTKNQGRPTLYLTGDVTNEQAAAIIAAEVGPNTENVYILGTTQLTTLDLSSITTILRLHVSSNEKLISLNLGGLKTIIDYFGVYVNPVLNTLSLPELKDAFGELDVRDNPAMSTISFPSLTTAKKLDIEKNNALATVSFPSLTTNEELYIKGNAGLTSVSLPVLKSCSGGMYSGMYINENLVLNAVSIPSLVKVGYNINLKSNALPSSQINALLHQMLSLATPNGYSVGIYLNNQIPLAQPTEQGKIDKQALLYKGFSVYTDSEPASLELTIKDSATEAIIPGATVILSTKDYSFEPNQTLTSDANGKVKFTGLNNNRIYKFQVSKDCKSNYSSINQINEFLLAGDTATYDVTLSTPTRGLIFIANNTVSYYSVSIAPASDPSQKDYMFGQFIPYSTHQTTPVFGSYILTATKMIDGLPSTVPADTTTKTVELSCGNPQLTVSIP